MSLRLAALWFDGSSPVVKVGTDSGPPLRAAGNLASNSPTPHVPGNAQPWLHGPDSNNAAQQAFWKIMTPQAVQMLKTHVNKVTEWKIRLHLQSSVASTCIVLWNHGLNPFQMSVQNCFQSCSQMFLTISFGENVSVWPWTWSCRISLIKVCWFVTAQHTHWLVLRWFITTFLWCYHCIHKSKNQGNYWIMVYLKVQVPPATKVTSQSAPLLSWCSIPINTTLLNTTQSKTCFNPNMQTFLHLTSTTLLLNFFHTRQLYLS